MRRSGRRDRRVGGREIENEALRKRSTETCANPCRKAIATWAGDLKAKYAIHAPTMKKPVMIVEKNNICLATDGAAKCAEEPKIKSITFPGPGTGVGGLSSKEVVIVMLSALKEQIN